MNGRFGIASVLYLLKFSLTKLVFKRRNASPLMKTLFRTEWVAG